MILKVLAGAAALASLGIRPVPAQVQRTPYRLPLELAVEAAQEAIRVCAAQGWPVSVSVVDTAGVVRAQLRGDHSTIHTETSSFRKAYTVVTLGPVFRFTANSEFVRLVAGNPGGPALVSFPNIVALAGAVAIRRGDEIVAAIGVGGAPGGDRDEACAAAGVARIQPRVTAAP